MVTIETVVKDEGEFLSLYIEYFNQQEFKVGFITENKGESLSSFKAQSKDTQVKVSLNK